VSALYGCSLLQLQSFARPAYVRLVASLERTKNDLSRRRLSSVAPDHTAGNFGPADVVSYSIVNEQWRHGMPPSTNMQPTGLRFLLHLWGRNLESGGADRDRTDDLRLAKPALSQLSYSPDKACGPGQT
jgi:hypothetical protein